MSAPSSPRVAVAAPNALAAQAGVDVVHLGGTAVDAAVAALMVTYVTEPGIVSALGSAYVNVWPVGGDPVVYDGNTEMPGRGLPKARFGGGLRELRLDYGGGITVYAGAGSAGTPGSLAAFDLARRDHGAAPWKDVLDPAIDAARRGFRIGAAAGSYLQLVGRTLYAFDPVTRAQHFDGDEPVGPGTLMTSPDLVDTFERIARDGVGTLYGGELGQAVADHVQREGGLITRADLAAYTAVARPATRATLRDWDVATNPPPSIGGPVLTAMLRLLRDRGLSPADVIEVQRQVLAYRSTRLDRAHDLKQAGRELLETLETAGLESLPTSTDTAHVSVVDANGMACAITTSAGYSSGVTVPGTGLILNNCLGEPELNRLGLHALPPGTRLASNMAPTTARHQDGSTLAIGSPGADRITTALMQVMSRFALSTTGIQEAIDAPRLHVQAGGDELVVDHEPDPRITAAIVATGGHGVQHEAHAMYFGGVGVAWRDAHGDLQAGADPRRAAATAIG
ncbi:gamma-glutamyltransferase [Leekyejoonella antrihumi]|uniref:Gamma-glutamyltranspeptidase n=1 Tax=Leekyejoonella antrihumi TaxID=1660198 RepID=A0A563E2U2_9MICO|nr:gamma-glutamyltransferase [Leekyejoonella antrihumi]TWP36521.1 gamma-glutamyltranspeptidase [Leekyejoonella antrihumi]